MGTKLSTFYKHSKFHHTVGKIHLKNLIFASFYTFSYAIQQRLFLAQFSAFFLGF
jgi:hypothetical protein